MASTSASTAALSEPTGQAASEAGEAAPAARTARSSDGLIDSRITRSPWRYALQCSLATGSVLLVLLVLDAAAQAALVAALGASCFIAFAMPHRRRSRARYMIGGHVVGLAVGAVARLGLSALADVPAAAGSAEGPVAVAVAATAVGVAILVMVATNTEHPPAASVALGMVLNGWSAGTILVVLAGVVGLSLIKRALRPVLIDLL